MSLLGAPLLVLLAVFAVGLPAATVALWSRWRGPRSVRTVQRLVSIMLCQVSAVLLLAVGVNDWGYFYASWSDLFGASSTNGRVVHSVGGAAAGGRTGVAANAAATSPALAPAATTAGVRVDGTWSSPAQWATRGRLETVTLDGPRSALREPAIVYLPPQYFQPAYAHTTFPAAEVMTGYPGHEQALVARLHYPGVLLEEMQAGRARPMVLVMLRPTVAPPRDTECTDVPAGPQALTYLAQDVPAAVRTLARVRPLGWGAVGDSTGGYCAVKLAMTHSDVFTSAVSLSGYFATLHDSTTGDLWGGSEVARELNDLQWRVTHLPAPPVSLLLTISREERGAVTGYTATRAFLAAARPPMQVDSLIEATGGHNFATWGAQLPQALDWLSRHLYATG
ncbi:alpha/beta hydrolase [Oryzihumus sp.]